MSFRCQPGNTCFRQPLDFRMDNPLQLTSFFRIREHQATETLSIEIAVRQEHPGTEQFHNTLQCQASRPDRLTGQSISIDNIYASLLKEARHGALAGGYPSCKANDAYFAALYHFAFLTSLKARLKLTSKNAR